MPEVTRLTNQGVQKILNDIHDSAPANVDYVVGLMVRVGGSGTPGGEGKSGEMYYALDGDLKFDKYNQQFVLLIPDAIAEGLRQQGRRQAQRAIQRELGL